MLLLVTQDGQRLDAFLASQNIVLSREKAKKLIAAGNVCVNTVIVKKMAYILSADDAVTVKAESNDQQNIAVEPIDQSLPVLFEDDACLVVNKPAGLAVHPGAGMEPGEKTLLNGIAFLFMGRGIPFSEEAVLVHRLDKETTGCLLVAKNAAAHKTLQKQFESRTVEKLYLALVAGIPSPASAVIDAPIGRSSMNRTRMSITGVGSVRHAKTTYRTLVTNMVHSTALVECDLHTGRTHQIRVHLHA
ncbi:MAG: RluA family pseudouridine synthase, partial [Candidatus Peribacteria bacterium]|nr:RluA family pseudouridine synthase [Candidatus Peribacteria bacterium]